MNTTTINSLSQIKNAYELNKNHVRIISNNLTLNIIKSLYKEGLILSYFKEEGTYNSFLNIYLRYLDNETPFLSLKIISKPSREIRLKTYEIYKLSEKQSVFVFSTSKGILNSLDCKKQKLGGILLFICV